MREPGSYGRTYSITRKIIANAKLETLVEQKGHGKIVEMEKIST